MSRIPVKVIDLNRLSYLKSLHIQKRLHQRVRDLSDAPSNERLNFLLLVEHYPPVYTVGIRNKQYADDEKFQKNLENLGAEFHVTNRGGLITFHGPGQLVAYPILNLRDFPETGGSIKKFVCKLERSLIDTCAEFGIIAETLPEYPGVWIEQDRKIAAIGLHCSRYVTMHGISLNCDVDLRWFEHIVPCGIEDKRVTSLSREITNTTATNNKVLVPEINTVKPLFVRHFAKHLDCSIIH